MSWIFFSQKSLKIGKPKVYKNGHKYVFRYSNRRNCQIFWIFFSQKNLRIGEHLHINDILIAVIITENDS